MITIDEYFIDSMPMDFIVTDSKGIVLKTNNLVINILNQINKTSITSIEDIDVLFATKNVNDRDQLQWVSNINGLIIYINVYKVKYKENNSCYLYLFNDINYKDNEIDMIFNFIDDIVLIVNKDKVVEKLNDVFYKLTGLDNKCYIGKNICELKKQGIMRESVILNVFKNKKPVMMNVKYKNGSIVTYTGMPVFDKNKELIKVIATGRNITKLVNLQTKLRKTEQQKQEYIIKLRNLENHLGENNFIYSSDKIKQVLKIGIKAAKTDSSIFIMGESGVGKEEIAKFIHENSNRKDGNFITVNCAAIPSELFESELFGYDEGAFTGAKKGGKRGLFEEADGGTLFLDEIGELTISMQTKLLRVLQENKIKHVGGNKSIKVNVRYICATNLSKQDLSNNLKFRQDVYYRLSVIPMTIPSLRDRREDIFPLIHSFLAHYNKKYNHKIKFSKKVIEFLYNYNWPGNVRELKNVVERLVILSEEDVVSENELYTIIQLEKNDMESNEGDILIKDLMNLNEAHRIVDEIMIKKALKKYGTITKAAKMLGIDPSTIHRKFKRGCLNIK